MKRLLAVPIILALLVFAAAPADAAWSGSRVITDLKMEKSGVIVFLEGFSLADVDPAACADPVRAYLWMRADAPGFQEQYAMLLSAVLSGLSVNISYYHCGDYSLTSPYLWIGSVALSAS